MTLLDNPAFLNMSNRTTTTAFDDNTTVLSDTKNAYDDDFNIDWGGDPREQDLYKAALFMIRVLFLPLVLLGTLANGLVLVVLRRGAVSTDNLRVFLSALAIVDTVFLYSSAFKTWLRLVSDFELLHLGSWACKLGLFINQLSLTLSAWLVVVVAWQRWYTCSRPFQRCCPVDNTRCGHVALGCVLLVLVAANSYVLFTAQLHQGQWGKQCVPNEEFDKVIGELFPYLMLTLYSGLPALLLLLLNGLLAHVLYHSRRALLSHSGSSRTHGGVDSDAVRARYNHVTVLLLALSACWMLLTLPHSIFKTMEPLSETAHERALHVFLNVLFFVLMYINHSINFFLYCALTKSFRREVKKMGRSCLTCLSSIARSFSTRLRSDSASSYIGQDNSTSQQQHPLHQHHSCHLHHHHHLHHYHHHHNQDKGNTDSFLPLIERYKSPRP